jgi:hypothetical protein
MKSFSVSIIFCHIITAEYYLEIRGDSENNSNVYYNKLERWCTI